ncbi:hypothetical protein Tsubulata_006875 [Turnera subulata]|uniref:F-box domain-containing protein n=1 Tax=Turnera subulata TaxID=218843 RepID=A0A9Q0JLS0_9ROSI|nr:hypothetical protein Tsubulata_006875 [Turnera subulata]
MAAANLRLPSEIVEEILTLLPSESIHRFRSVSKSWSSLLVSEEFQKMRFKSAPPELNFQKLLHRPRKKKHCTLYYEYDYEDDDYGMPLESFDYRGDEETPTEVTFPERRSVVIFKGSCNGLVCLAQASPVNDYGAEIFVWNPFTGVYRKLPDLSDDMMMRGAYGFGYDSTADDYKVFMVAAMVQIFSLKRGSWERVENSDRCLQYITGPDSGLLLKGALHWRDVHTEKITAFDLSEEKFYDVPAPPQQESLALKGIGIVGEYLFRVGDNHTGGVWKIRVACFYPPRSSSNGKIKNGIPLRHLQDIEEGDRGLFLNGALHWRKEYAAKISALDLVKEKFGDVPAPLHPGEKLLQQKGIGIVGEYLCMSWFPLPRFDSSLVWVMKEYLNKESWVPFIDYRPSLLGQCVVCYHCNFIADSVEDKEDEGYLMFYLHDEVPTTEILQCTKNLGKSDREEVVTVNYYEHSRSIPCTEALTSPYPSLVMNKDFEHSSLNKGSSLIARQIEVHLFLFWI